MYCKHTRPLILNDNPEMKQTEVVKHQAAAWKLLSADERAAYEKMSADDVARYRKVAFCSRVIS